MFGRARTRADDSHRGLLPKLLQEVFVAKWGQVLQGEMLCALCFIWRVKGFSNVGDGVNLRHARRARLKCHIA